MAVAALAVFATAAGAGTVVVAPASMGGWTIGFQENGSGVNPVGEFAGTVAEAPAGTGAFHMKTLSQTLPPGQVQKVYLGTNNYTGVALNDITAFKYYTYLGARDFEFAGVEKEPGGQPPLIEIITDSGDGSFQQRRFQYRPYGWDGQYHVSLGVWQEWDLMAPEAADGQKHWEMSYQGSSNCWGDWNWLKSRYSGTMRFSTPLVGDMVDGWDPDWYLGNESATSISILVGPGMTSAKVWNPFQTEVKSFQWWREGSGIDAYTDKLLIEVNGVQTIYDFEGGRVVGMSTRDATSGLMATGIPGPLKVVLWGKVLAFPAPSGSYFYMDDGSGVEIQVMATNTAQAGEYWRAEGSLDTVNLILTCAPGDVIKLN
jgi:hypothetical protein